MRTNEQLQNQTIKPSLFSRGAKMGVVVGSGAGGIKTLCNAVDALLKQEYSKILTSYYPKNLGPALLAIETGFTGAIILSQQPVPVPTTACTQLQVTSEEGKQMSWGQVEPTRA
ncbi:beta-ketoacyl-[acyl-carrier-protein] synthase II [Sarracenia purpurea var. burkii]